MTTTRSWLEQQLRRKRGTTLDAALLGGQADSYAWIRLRLLLPRALLRTVLHALEFATLTRNFPFEFLIPLFALRALPAMLSGFHWGALETLRIRVRGDARARPARAQAATETWLAWTLGISMAATALVCLAIGSAESEESGPLGIYGSFAVLTALATSLELYARTYYAGVYALGRAYRPPWAFFLPECLEISVLVLSQETFGPFALHLAMITGCLLRNALTLYYARRAYDARSLPVPHPFRIGRLKRFPRQDAVTAVRHAFSILPQQFDRMFLLALLHAPMLASSALPLAAPYYVLRPIFSLAQSWPRVFFPDFVRVHASNVPVLRTRFLRIMRRISFATGAASALLACAASAALFGLGGLLASLWFVPLCLTRSAFSLMQVRDFAFGAQTALYGASLCMASALALLALLDAPDRPMLAMVTLLLLATMLIQRKLATPSRLVPARHVGLTHMLAVLSRVDAPLRLCCAHVDDRYARVRPLLTRMEAALTSGQVARLGRSQLLWWEPIEMALSRLSLAKLSAGTLRSLHVIEADTGLSALNQLSQQTFVPEEVRLALNAQRTDTPPTFAEIRALAGDCQAIDLEAKDVPRETLADTSCGPRTAARAKDLARIRQALVAEAHGRPGPRRTGTLDLALALYAPAGEAKYIFLWPKLAPHAAEAAKRIRVASVRDSLKRPGGL